MDYLMRVIMSECVWNIHTLNQSTWNLFAHRWTVVDFLFVSLLLFCHKGEYAIVNEEWNVLKHLHKWFLSFQSTAIAAHLLENIKMNDIEASAGVMRKHTLAKSTHSHTQENNSIDYNSNSMFRHFFYSSFLLLFFHLLWIFYYYLATWLFTPFWRMIAKFSR